MEAHNWQRKHPREAREQFFYEPYMLDIEATDQAGFLASRGR
jgi:hypothetical protein